MAGRVTWLRRRRWPRLPRTGQPGAGSRRALARRSRRARSEGAAVMEREERPATEVVARKRASEVRVAPNDGALVMWLTPGAKVVLARSGKQTRKTTQIRPRPERHELTLRSLTPGKYQLEVTHPDYQPYDKPVVVGRGELVARCSRPGFEVRLRHRRRRPSGLKGVDRRQELTSADYKTDEQGRIVVRRVLVGSQRSRSVARATTIGRSDRSQAWRTDSRDCRAQASHNHAHVRTRPGAHGLPR